MAVAIDAARGDASSNASPNWRVLMGCRICRRVLLVAVFAIMAVEALILIPSIQGFKRDAFAQIEQQARVAVTSAELLGGAEGRLSGDELSALVGGGLRITGAAVYRPGLDYPDVMGEAPNFTPQVFAALGTQGRITADETRYEVLIEQMTPEGSQSLVLRLNSEDVAQRVSAFFWRVMGLVLVIASFVGTAIVGSVWKWIVQPVITLRNALTSARRDPLGAERWQVQVDHTDEIGELLHETNDLLVAISGNYRDDVGALSMLVQGASDAVIVYDKAGLVTFANDAAKALALCKADTPERGTGPYFMRAGDLTRRSVSDLIAGTSFHGLVTLLDGSREVPCQLLAARVRFGVVALLRI